MATTTTDGRQRLRGGLEATDRHSPPAPPSKHDGVLAELLKVAATCCSSEWAKDVRMGRTAYPPAGMLLSRCHVSTGGESNNKGEIGTRRWTPSQNVNLEDMLDGMSIKQAKAYYHPPAAIYAARWIRGEAAYDPQRQPVAMSGLGTTMKIKPWKVKRSSVRIRVHGVTVAFEEWHDFPEDLTIVITAS